MKTCFSILGFAMYLTILCGCLNKSKAVFSEISIVIYSPYGCINEINVSSSGQGRFRSGIKSSDENNERIDSTTYENTFDINGKDNLNPIMREIEKLKQAKDQITGYKSDAYRYLFIVDGVIKIDVYGSNEFFDNFLLEIFKYLPMEKGPCEYWKLFEKVHSLNDLKR